MNELPSMRSAALYAAPSVFVGSCDIFLSARLHPQPQKVEIKLIGKGGVGDALAVGMPFDHGGMLICAMGVGVLGNVAAVYIHCIKVNLERYNVRPPDKENLAAIRREDGVALLQGIVGEVDGITAIGADFVDIPIVIFRRAKEEDA